VPTGEARLIGKCRIIQTEAWNKLRLPALSPFSATR